MLSTQISEPEVVVSVQPRRPLTSTVGRRLSPIVSLTLVLLFVAACAPGEAPPDAICDTYNRALFTTQLMGGAAVLLGLAILGFRKNVSAILPSQGAQVGAVAGSVFLGLILLAFSTDIGNQILLGFGIESLWVLCGLG
jgi:branched-subunit amino acid permease